ncbi:MAG: peptidase M48 [Desulfobacteraceae bacterium 4572_19]|nr:MAG: peptidase M48 [Desulfobacteraceae bacterium 4572_19]
MSISSTVITTIILITIISDYLLHTLADFLNISKLQNTPPDSFKDLYDSDKYKKSQEYLKINTLLGFVSSTFFLIVTISFWFLKGFLILDNWARSFNLNPIATGLLFIGTLLILKTILALPFSLYSTFIIEENFGFNKTTWKTFIIDAIKGIILSTILVGIILFAILSFFQYAGANAWWQCWIAISVFMLAVQHIVPTWIMPLFNKFTPLEDGKLRDAIFSYAKSINFSLNNVFIMDGSKRSSKSNAFFTGFGKNKRIVLFDTLIAQHEVPELVAVLAHEMGHFKKKHIIKMILSGIIQAGIMFYLLSIFLSCQGMFEAFFINKISIYAGLVFFGMLYSPIDFFTGIIIQKISRNNEFEADNFAVTTTNNPTALKDALKKLSVNNLSNLLPHPLFVILNYSHPPILERIETIDAIDNKIT